MTYSSHLFSTSCADVESRKWALSRSTLREWQDHRVRHHSFVGRSSSEF